MEFSFDVKSLFPSPITRVVGGKPPGTSERATSHSNHLEAVVDEMGKASANAQGLRVPITTYQKLVTSNHILYVMADGGGQRGSVVGILKLGYKRLFLTDGIGVIHEVEPLCVLDFYVHESRQRSGCGKKLFEEMLKTEGVKPFEVAIDRPSPKFLAFLMKHYQLKSFVKQANNYVVFDLFFSTCKELGQQARRFVLPSGAKRWIAKKPSPLSLFATHGPAHTTSSTDLDCSGDFNWSPDKTKRTLDSTKPTPSHLHVHVGLDTTGDYNWSPDKTKRTLDSTKPTPSHIGLDTTGDYNWSPDKTKRTLNSTLSPKESEFNIITGKQKKDSFYSNDYSYSPKRQSDTQVFTGRNTDLVRNVRVQQQSESCPISNKAPHLNIRRDSLTQIGEQLSKSDKHASSTCHVTFGSGHVKYSRHTRNMSGSRHTSGKQKHLTHL